MPAKKPTKKARRPVKVEKKAPQKPQKTKSLENRVVEIGKHVETLIKRRGPVRLADAHGEILEKLPQMIEGLSSQLEQIGKREVLEKLDSLPEKLRSEFQKAQVVKRGAEGKELKSEIQSLREEVHALRQALDEMRSSFDQVVSKASPSASEEQPKQAEEPKTE